jgi:hypothetical protein
MTYANFAVARGNELVSITARYQPLLMSANNVRASNKSVTIGNT